MHLPRPHAEHPGTNAAGARDQSTTAGTEPRQDWSGNGRRLLKQLRPGSPARPYPQQKSALSACGDNAYFGLPFCALNRNRNCRVVKKTRARAAGPAVPAGEACGQEYCPGFASGRPPPWATGSVPGAGSSRPEGLVPAQSSQVHEARRASHGTCGVHPSGRVGPAPGPAACAAG